MVLSHHPFRGGWLADQKDADGWVRSRAQLHLSGHVHEADSEQARSGDGRQLLRVDLGRELHDRSQKRHHRVVDVSDLSEAQIKALRLAMNKLLKSGVIVSDPIIDHVAAVSCGIYGGQAILDLDYAEDSVAGTDANFVMTGTLGLIEVQGSAEGATFTRAQLGELLDLAEKGVGELVAAQRAAIA